MLWPTECGGRFSQEPIDGSGKGSSGRVLIVRKYQGRGGLRPLTDQLSRTAMIERYDRRPERERFRHAQSRLLMKGRMQKGTCSCQLRKQLIPRKPPLESNAIRQAPPPYRPLEASLLRPLPAEAQNRIRSLDISEGLKCDHRCLPSQQAPHEQHIVVALRGRPHSIELNR
jgi:hypothetical protein